MGGSIITMSARGAKDRRKQFKGGIDTDESRRRREETTVQLRKSKREDSLQKRRKDVEQEQGGQVAAQPGPAAGIHDLGEMIAGVSSEDRERQREATVKFRKLLSIERSPPIQEVINSGVVPRFVQFLKCADDTQLQFEAAWALTNIAGDSPKCRDLVLSHGALQPLLTCMNENQKISMLRNATWTLSNFCRGKPTPT